MAINTTAIRSFLEPGLNAVFGSYDSWPAAHTQIFTQYQSEKAVEHDIEFSPLGLAQVKAEGAKTSYDTMGQRTQTNYQHKYVALGFIVTRQAIKDNLYKSQFPMQAKSLRTSFMQTKEVQAAAVFNNAFDSAYPIGDGNQLCDTDHRIDTGTQANTPSTQVDLNETSLEAAWKTIKKWRDWRNRRINITPKKLIVPIDNAFVAERLLKSDKRIGTANNDISAVVSMGVLPEGYMVHPYLTDTTAWFIKTDADNGFKHFQREKFETGMSTDDDTQNLKVWGIERYSFGVSDWRCVYGSSGAA